MGHLCLFLQMCNYASPVIGLKALNNSMLLWYTSISERLALSVLHIVYMWSPNSRHDVRQLRSFVGSSHLTDDYGFLCVYNIE